MYQTLLYTHIFLGAVSLITGAVAAFSNKKRGTHTTAGKLFVLSMLSAAVAGILITLIRPNPFLLSIALFTIYMTLMGFSAFKNDALRKILPYGGLAVALYMLFTAIFSLNGVSIVALVFGSVQLLFSISDLRSNSKNKVVLHASRIGGAYIASTTAFMVTALSFLPWYIGWFIPSVVGSILLSKGIRSYVRPKVKSEQST